MTDVQTTGMNALAAYFGAKAHFNELQQQRRDQLAQLQMSGAWQEWEAAQQAARQGEALASQQTIARYPWDLGQTPEEVARLQAQRDIAAQELGSREKIARYPWDLGAPPEAMLPYWYTPAATQEQLAQQWEMWRRGELPIQQAQAGLIGQQAQWYGPTAEAGIAQTQAQTGLIGEQARWFGPTAQASIAQAKAQAQAAQTATLPAGVDPRLWATYQKAANDYALVIGQGPPDVQNLRYTTLASLAEVVGAPAPPPPPAPQQSWWQRLWSGAAPEATPTAQAPAVARPANAAAARRTGAAPSGQGMSAAEASNMVYRNQPRAPQ